MLAYDNATGKLWNVPAYALERYIKTLVIGNPESVHHFGGMEIQFVDIQKEVDRRRKKEAEKGRKT